MLSHFQLPERMPGTERGQRVSVEDVRLNETWVNFSFHLTPQDGDIELLLFYCLTPQVWCEIPNLCFIFLSLQGWIPSWRSMNFPKRRRWTFANRSWRGFTLNLASQASKEPCDLKTASSLIYPLQWRHFSIIQSFTVIWSWTEFLSSLHNKGIHSRFLSYVVTVLF